MPINLHEYWAGVRAQRDSLPPGNEFWLVSIPSKDHAMHKAGVVCAADRQTTAKVLFEQTHRLASPEEIAQYHAEVQERTTKLAADEQARKQQFAPPPELQNLVAAALIAAQPQPNHSGANAPQEQNLKKRGGN